MTSRSVIAVMLSLAFILTIGPVDLASTKGEVYDAQVGDPHYLGINGLVFDTRNGEPLVPAALRVTDYPAGGDGYYIVQFSGPVTEEHKESLARVGAEIVNYVPSNAFLVRMAHGLRSSLEKVQAVQWTGVFQPAYKIVPELTFEAGIVEAQIITFNPDGVNAVLELLPERRVIYTYEGKDFGRVDARVTYEQVVEIACLADVNFIQPREVPEVQNRRMQWIMQTNVQGDRRIWDVGISGEGQLVGFSDTGIDFDHNFFRENATTIQKGDIYNVTDTTRRKLVRYWVHGGANEEWAWKDSPNRWDPGAGWATIGHGTMVTGTFGGNDDPIGSSTNDGGAKGAKIFFQDIGDVRQWGGYWRDALAWIPSDYDNLFGPAYNAGARVHSGSWGSSTTAYTQGAQMLDEFMWDNPDMLIIFSNGNGGGGWYDVVSPATAKNVLSSGSSATSPNQNSVADYSSPGPTSDGRRKPTVIAVGEGTSSMSTGNPRDDTNTAWEAGWGGTSYSAPDHASLAAMTRQYFMEGWWPTGTKNPADGFEPSAALVKGVLAASAQQMTGSYTDRENENTWPNNAQGWGRVLLDDALYFAGDTRRMEIVDDTSSLSTGESRIESYFVLDSAEPLRVMLTWTDYPGVAWTTPNIVNDLDLLVTDPLGTTYKGNVMGTFAQGESQPDTGSYDRLNVQEGVHIKSPMVGAWTIEVIGYNVPSGPQPYALVALGDLGTGWGQVYLDRSVYGDSDTIGITVRDTGPTGVNVTIWSMTEPAPETVSLNESAPGSGRWTGTIDTTTGAPTTDGQLQVSEGDLVTVQYDDMNPIHTSTDTATIDASAPLIFNLLVTNITSTSANVIWRTNEPADSRVYYNTSAPLDMEEYMSGYRIQHDVLLTGLQPETMYMFDVESSDPYDHTTTDTNGGLHYNFTTLKLSPEPPTNLRAWLFGPNYEHVHIEWDLSADDATMIDHYTVYYNTGAYNPDGTGYQFLVTVPQGFNFYDHYNMGHLNPMNIFYYVEANYSAGLPARTEDQAAKFTRWTPPGNVLLSFPLKMVNETIEYALQTVSWDMARFYDPWTEEWRENHIWKNWNDLLTVNQSMAIWVNVTSAEPVTSSGVVPKSAEIFLKEGWNLVGFPHLYWDYTAGDLMAQTGAEKAESFNAVAPPYYLYRLTGPTYMAPGEGYWIKVPADTMWML
ncbi:MAG: S8 family serine peptidase [Candidatus Thermoplasmatota archaeon]|nr:S8 family serine peptidase [Candidatus Thermoplasmatota archaeon]